MNGTISYIGEYGDERTPYIRLASEQIKTIKYFFEDESDVAILAEGQEVIVEGLCVDIPDIWVSGDVHLVDARKKRLTAQS